MDMLKELRLMKVVLCGVKIFYRNMSQMLDSCGFRRMQRFT